MNEFPWALSSIGLKGEMILEGVAESVLREPFENLGLHMPCRLRRSFADSSLECNMERECKYCRDVILFIKP